MLSLKLKSDTDHLSSPARRLKAMYVLDDCAYERIFGPEERVQISRCVDIIAPVQSAASVVDHESLYETQIIFSGWGAPLIDEAFLEKAPALEAIFYGAGAINHFATSAIWDRGIVISSAYAANAVPVAEYTLAVILFSLKQGWRLARDTRSLRAYPSVDEVVGSFGSTIGLISLGMIARRLLELLRPFDLRVLLYDPFVSREEAAELGVELVSLDVLFRESLVVSLHAPLLEETVGLVTGEHVRSMQKNATFINTARGGVVREVEVLEVLAERSDLTAVLDVVCQEPPPADSMIYDMPNVILTPHIAGSLGRECQRLGRLVYDELSRYLANQPLQWAVTPELARRTSHRLSGQAALS